MTKHHFRQRVPAYIDGVEPVEFDFDTLEELEQHSLIQRFLKVYPSSHLCNSDDYLMVVSNDGLSSWCIGRITNMDELRLPVCERKNIVQYSDGRIEIKTKNGENPVVMICGDKATLKDGTVCKHLWYENCKKDPSLWKTIEELLKNGVKNGET